MSDEAAPVQLTEGVIFDQSLADAKAIEGRNQFLTFCVVLVCILCFFGRLIYGGIYWGILNESQPRWNDDRSPSALRSLQMHALLQWVFCLCVPFGSFICTCIIIGNTKQAQCENYKLLLIDTNQTDHQYFEELSSYMNQTVSTDLTLDEQLDEYMYKRCRAPHIAFSVFLPFHIVFNLAAIFCCFRFWLCGHFNPLYK